MNYKRINFRYSILAFSIITLITFIFIFLTSKQSSDLAVENILEHEEASLDIYEEIIYDELNRSVRDLNYLVNTLELAYLNDSNCNISSEFLLYSQSFNVYDQIRFIDSNGLEKVRVDLSNDGSYVVDEKDLQDKSNRDYFIASQSLKHHEIYMSPVALNQENGRIEEPYKPVARYLIRSDVLDGYVVLNYKVEALLEYLNDYVEYENRTIYMVNNNGSYIKQTNDNVLLDTLLPEQVRFDDLYPGVRSPSDVVVESAESYYFVKEIHSDKIIKSTSIKNTIPVYLITSIQKDNKVYPFMYESNMSLLINTIEDNIFLLVLFLMIAFVAGIIIGNKQYEDHYINKALKYVAEFDGDYDAENYIHSLVKYLEDDFQTKYVFVDKVLGDNQMAETIAMVCNGEFMSNITYNLNSTPCENVYDRKLCCYKAGIQELFPKDELLVDMAAESYIGIPLFSSNGKAVGLIALIDDKVLKNTKLIEKVLKIVAIRAGQDLERMLHEEELHKTIDVTNNIINATEEGVIVYDEELRYTLWNKKAAEWTETIPHEVIGKKVLDVFPFLEDSDLYRIIENASKGEHDFGHEYMYTNPSGQEIWFRDHTKPLLINNEIKGAIKTLVNISSYKENELRLEEAIERANTASEAKSRFLANMSHELRTPMNGMLGMIELALMSEPSEELEGYLSVAQKSGFALVDILNDILEYSSVESGMVDLSLEKVHLKDVMRNVLDLHKPLADTKGIDIIVDYDIRIPYSVVIDSRRLKQIGTNLLGNAVKFTNEGYVKLKIEMLDKNEEDVTVRFHCIDTGIGIEEKDIEFIFNRFTQVDTSNVRKYGGVGLGLSIAHSNVSLLGGDLKCMSQVGQGTEFTFDLTLSYDDQITNVDEKDVEKLSDSATHEVKVLIVDDDPTSCRILETFLERKGYECVIATSGLQAIEAFVAQHLDIILMDISMPEMDGIKAMKIIRENSKGTNVKIVAQTAFAHDDDRKRFMDEGFDGFISKPINFIYLNKLIDTLLKVD